METGEGLTRASIPEFSPGLNALTLLLRDTKKPLGAKPTSGFILNVYFQVDLRPFLQCLEESNKICFFLLGKPNREPCVVKINRILESRS